MLTAACVLLIAAHTLLYVNGESIKRSYKDPNPIMFPGPIKELTNKYGSKEDESLELPTECKGKTFCTVMPKNYPQDKFNKLFKGYKPIDQPTLVDDQDSLNNRQGDPNEKDGCQSIVTYEPLYMVKAEDGMYRTVVQAPEENYIQRIRLEHCLDTKSKCFTVFPMDDSMETFCRTRYSSWQLLVQGGPNGTERIRADLPVCCSCRYKIL